MEQEEKICAGSIAGIHDVSKIHQQHRCSGNIFPSSSESTVCVSFSLSLSLSLFLSLSFSAFFFLCLFTLSFFFLPRFLCGSQIYVLLFPPASLIPLPYFPPINQINSRFFLWWNFFLVCFALLLTRVFFPFQLVQSSIKAITLETWFKELKQETDMDCLLTIMGAILL